MNWASQITTIVLFTLLCGCSQSLKSDGQQQPENLMVTKTAGGTHHRAESHRGFWLQLAGSDLLVIDPVTAVTVAIVPLEDPDHWAEAVDMVITDDRLWVLLDGQDIVELDVSNPQQAKVLKRTSQSQLDLRPRHLTKRGSQVWVSGDQGFRRIDQGLNQSQLQSTEGRASRIVFVDGRPIVCVGRRIIDAERGAYLGSATQLYRLPGVIDPQRRFLFIREGRQGSLVGLMSEGMREVHGGASGARVDRTTASPGTLVHLGHVHSVRFIDDSIWVVGDGGIDVFRIHGDALVRKSHIPVRGPRDIMPIADNYFAVAGSFGRSMYRLNSDDLGPGDTFFNVVRVPGGLKYAASDGRNLLAGSDEGYWVYRSANNEVVSWASPNTALPEPAREAVTTDYRVMLGAEGTWAELDDGDHQAKWFAPEGTTLSTIAAVEGLFWIGHHTGIIVLKVVDVDELSGQDRALLKPGDEIDSVALVEVASISLKGPILALQPLLSGRGAAFASEAGFGIVEWDSVTSER